MSTNNNFANAILLTGLSGSVSGDTRLDTLEAGEPRSNTVVTSVWYSYSPADKYVKLSTVDASEESISFAYQGSALNALTEVSIGDYTAPSTHTAIYLSRSGFDYQVQVGIEPWGSEITSTGFTLSWVTLDRFPAALSPNTYLILEDDLLGSGAITTKAPVALWPSWGAWDSTPGVSRTANGLLFSTFTFCQIPIVQEYASEIAFDVSVLSKNVGTSTYGSVGVRFKSGDISLTLRDYGSGFKYYLKIYRGGSYLEYSADPPSTVLPGEFAELRLRFGRGKVEAVVGSTTLISEAWDGMAGLVLAPALTRVVALEGSNQNVLKDLSVVLSSVDLPPVEAPAPPDGSFWGGFINSAETLQVL